MSVQTGKSGASASKPTFHVDMWNTKKSWLGAPTSNLIYTVPLAFSTYAQCTGPVAADAYDELAEPVTVNRYTIISATSAARAAVRYTSLVVGATYSFSCKMRYNGTNTASPSLYVDASKGYPEASGSNTLANITTTFTPIGNGIYSVRYTFTVSASPTLACIMTYGVATGADTAYVGNTFDVWNEQFEAQPFPTRFVKGSRASTAAIVDMLGYGGAVTPNTITYSASDKFTFNGTTDRCSAAVQAGMLRYNNNTYRAWEIVVTPTASMTFSPIFGGSTAAGARFNRGGIVVWNGYYSFTWFDNAAGDLLLSSTVQAAIGVTTHIVVTWDPVAFLPRIYINGALNNTWGSASDAGVGSTPWELYIGSYGIDNDSFIGDISVMKYYQGGTPLTDADISKSFESYRGRYGI